MARNFFLHERQKDGREKEQAAIMNANTYMRSGKIGYHHLFLPTFPILSNGIPYKKYLSNPVPKSLPTLSSHTSLFHVLFLFVRDMHNSPLRNMISQIYVEKKLSRGHTVSRLPSTQFVKELVGVLVRLTTCKKVNQ